MYEKTDSRLGKGILLYGHGKRTLAKSIPITRFHLKRWRFEQVRDVEGLCICANNLGLVYEKLQMYDSAMYWHTRSLGLAEQSHSVVHIGYSYFNIGAIYYRQGDYERALEYEKISRSPRTTGIAILWADRTNFLGNIWTHPWDEMRALSVFQQAIANSLICIGAPRILKDSYDSIATNWPTGEIADSAYPHCTSEYTSDSLKGASVQKWIAEMQSRDRLRGRPTAQI